MGELYPDSKYAPWEIPSDAVLVLKWSDGVPSRWEVVAMGSGFTTLIDVSEALKDQFPDLDAENVLVTQVGGNRARVKRMNVATQTTRTLREVDPTPPGG